ncbi:MAG: Crp/Fnr family transcriptional regulator [Candidatus Eremiobacteraeota bacterium]|nr:Crp/Fnr family transcriptional regulator [Candidatus Eremiobacteraeota bacterium]
MPLFSELGSKELEDLEGIAVSTRFHKGEYIFFQGEEGGAFFIIISGKVKIVRDSPSGREITLAALSRGDSFGELSLLDGKSRSASVVAISKAEVLVIFRGDFEEYLRTHPEVAIKLLTVYAGRLRDANRRIEDLACHSVRGRLAQMMLDSVAGNGVICEEGVVFQLPSSHKEIASQLGTSRETVSRTLAALCNEGFIRMMKSQVTVPCLESLRSLVL